MIRFLLSRRGAFRLLWLLLGGFIAFCSFDAFSSRLLPLLMKWRTDREKEKAIDDIAFRRREREREREREKSSVNVVVSSDARRCVDFDVRETYTKKHFDRFANTLQAWKWADLGDDEKNTIKSDERSRRMKFCVIRTRRRHVVFTFIACVCA